MLYLILFVHTVAKLGKLSSRPIYNFLLKVCLQPKNSDSITYCICFYHNPSVKVYAKYALYHFYLTSRLAPGPLSTLIFRDRSKKRLKSICITKIWELCCQVRGGGRERKLSYCLQLNFQSYFPLTLFQPTSGYDMLFKQMYVL